jgi:O-6-methylguanine DNA methyltransferase
MTSFAVRVLSILRRIPAGRVTTYGDVARLAGQPRAARAVGNVLRAAAEPALPYHRVVASGGRIGGYGRNPALKRALLVAEGHLVRGGRLIGFRAARWPSDPARSRPRDAAPRKTKSTLQAKPRLPPRRRATRQGRALV